MANIYDPTRLIPDNYNLRDPVDVLRFNRAVEDFVDLVRNNAAYFNDKIPLIQQFVRLVNDDNAFALAKHMVPEFSEPQSIDFPEDKWMNVILNAIKHRRPPVPLGNTQNAPERRLVKERLRSMVEYIVYDAGRAGATQAQINEAEQLFDQASNVLMPDA